MSNVVLLTFGVVIFVGVLLVFTFAWWGWANRAEERRRRLAHRLGLDRNEAAVSLQRATQGQPWRWVQAQLDRAGDDQSPRDFAVQVALWLGAGALLSVWFLPGAEKLVGVIAGAIPLLLLRYRARQRSRQLTLQLPEALDRIGRTLRAGHAFSDALRLAADELPSPIGQELARVSETHRLGIDLRDCLSDLARRHSDSFDLRLFVSAVLLHRDTGGNLAIILDHLAETVRERLVFEQKVAALTAETNVSALILGALPFVLGSVLLLLRPAYLLPLVTTDLGRLLLFGAGLSLAAGAVAMRWFARVEV